MYGNRRNVLSILVSLMSVAFLLAACAGSAATNTPVSPASPTQVPASPLSPSATAVTAPSNAPATVAAATRPAAATGAPAAPTATAAIGTPSAAATQTEPAATIPNTAAASIPTDTVTAFPDPAAYTWAPFTSGLQKPLGMADPQDGSGRLFFLEQPGMIRIYQNGQLLSTPFLDIRSQVGSRGTEQGLLGIALHPDYKQNGYFYVNYTNTSGNTVIARYSVSANDPNQADPNSEKILLQVDQPYANHNGGSLVFGPDGFLYMGLGDGGSGGDPHGNAQNVNVLLGKLLRVDVNQGDPYAIPPSNPFANGGGKPEIWAYGLRNPWRFSFDRLTGDLYIGDVGQNQWEEIDFRPADAPGGANFGWNYREGLHPYQGNPPAGVNFVDPVYNYSHAKGCSVTGGYVYRGQELPAFRGVYLFSDYCSGTVWGLLRDASGNWQSKELFQTGKNVTSFGQDGSGEIYLITQAGEIYRLQQK